MEYISALIGAFLLAIVMGRLLIPVLRRLKIGQSVRDVGPRQHQRKAGTPTMGGVIFILAAVIVSVALGPRDAYSILVVFATLGYASVGFADDFLKVVLKQPLGLMARHKLTGQILVAGLLYWGLRSLNIEHSLVIPGLAVVNLGLFYPLFIAFFLVGFANAVNLSDGVDGLASGLGVITLFAGGLVAMLSGLDGVGLTAIALAGGLLGFLVFNIHPARVFMGDTGALALGGAVAAIAILTKTELLLLLFGAMFVIITLSVIIQVTYFKLTGRRVILMSPLHHHFELLGWSEWKICRWFWLAQTVLAGLGVVLWTVTV